MDEEAKAAKRYKLLMREKDRLAKAGKADSDIDGEIGKLVERFPALAGAVLPQLTQSTVAMLAFAEVVKAEEEAANAQKPVAEETAQQLPTNHQTSASTEAPSQPAKESRGGADARLIGLFGAAAAVLRIWNDLFIARPKIGAVSLAKCLAVAVISAVLHFWVIDRCGAGVVFDPLLYCLFVNVSAIVRIRAASSVERFFVFLLRDTLPSLASVLVVYSIMDTILTFLARRAADSC